MYNEEEMESVQSSILRKKRSEKNVDGGKAIGGSIALMIGRPVD